MSLSLGATELGRGWHVPRVEVWVPQKTEVDDRPAGGRVGLATRLRLHRRRHRLRPAISPSLDPRRP